MTKIYIENSANLRYNNYERFYSYLHKYLSLLYNPKIHFSILILNINHFLIKIIEGEAESKIKNKTTIM